MYDSLEVLIFLKMCLKKKNDTFKKQNPFVLRAAKLRKMEASLEMNENCRLFVQMANTLGWLYSCDFVLGSAFCRYVVSVRGCCHHVVEHTWQFMKIVPIRISLEQPFPAGEVCRADIVPIWYISKLRPGGIEWFGAAWYLRSPFLLFPGVWFLSWWG